MLSKNPFKQMVDHLPNMVWSTGIDKGCVYFNPSWLQFTGRTYEEEKGLGWIDGIHLEDLDRCLYLFEKHFDIRKNFILVYRYRRHDGEYRWVSNSGAPNYSEDGIFTGFVGTCSDITDQVIGSRFKTRAIYDGLTGVYNRQQFFELLEENTERARLNYSPLVLMMLDVDAFRAVNKDFGHSVGDEVLKSIANILKRTVRANDLIGRFGGDAFLVGLTETDSEGANLVCKRILEETRSVNHLILERELTVSIGIAEFQNEMTLQELIQLADSRLLAAQNDKE
jgi:diguanylate cyclase (GGDEF)-like protein/PAS domain S-box-containing protein